MLIFKFLQLHFLNILNIIDIIILNNNFNIKYYIVFIYGIIAKAVSGNPNNDFLLAILISHDKAISKPPPKAAPSIEAMVGKGKL